MTIGHASRDIAASVSIIGCQRVPQYVIGQSAAQRHEFPCGKATPSPGNAVP